MLPIVSKPIEMVSQCIRMVAESIFLFHDFIDGAAHIMRFPLSIFFIGSVDYFTDLIGPLNASYAGKAAGLFSKLSL